MMVYSLPSLNQLNEVHLGFNDRKTTQVSEKVAFQ